DAKKNNGFEKDTQYEEKSKSESEEINGTDGYSSADESTRTGLADNSGQGEAVEEKTNWVKEVISWFVMVAVILAAIWFLTNFIIVNARIPSGSMENTIMTGDRLIGERFAYWFSDPKRGDIVLFHWPVEPDTIYIKRVIGLPGETVTIKGGKIYINDSKTPLKEDYLKEEWTVDNDGYTFHVPKDSYLMLGDNRNNSADSRDWAEEALEYGVAKTDEQAQKYTYVKKSAIIGKAWFRYFGGFKNLTNTAHY
ncbi:MAG: signal peptidase I, partial [Candidatus Weimeria sp.]